MNSHLLKLLFLLLMVLPVPTLSAAEQNENIVWIDVRSARDYRAGHLEGAINIFHGDIGHKIFDAVPDLFKEIHIYDASFGTSAGLALEMLMELGYQEVVNEGAYEQLLIKQAAKAPQ